MAAQTWLSRLQALPRLQGQVELNAYDSALRRLFVTQYTEFDGQLSTQEALEAGLLRAIHRFPVVTGSIQERQSDRALLLMWGTHNHNSSSTMPKCGFSWSYEVKAGSSPSIFSTWELWCKGAMPSIHTSQVAAAKVTVFPDVNKSILILTFDHALFDVPAANRFVHCWFQETAALACSNTNMGSTATATLAHSSCCSCNSKCLAGSMDEDVRDIATASSMKVLNMEQVFPFEATVVGADSNSSSISLQDWRISTEAAVDDIAEDLVTTAPSGASFVVAVPEAADGAKAQHSCAAANAAASAASMLTATMPADTDRICQAKPASISRSSSQPLTDALQRKLSTGKLHLPAVDSTSAPSCSIFDRTPYYQPTCQAANETGVVPNASCQQHLSHHWPNVSCKQSCKEWLDTHRGENSPFPWDPLDHAQYSEMGWKTHQAGLKTIVSVWKIPHGLLSDWKAAATAAAPLPDGMWYSSNTAAAAMLAAVMYAAAPAQYQQQGGMYVGAVVDIRGGRCGLSVPRDSATNASIWGVRTWVPVELLEAADGKPSPALMHHLRTDMQRELTDPAGAINRQFAWYAAAQVVGAASQVHLCQGLQQVDQGDMMLDWLPQGATNLPTIPGTSVSACAVRFPPCFFDRVFMAMPVPHTAGQGPGFDIQVEVALPRAITPKVFSAWEQLGMQKVAVPSLESRSAVLGWYWQPLDFLAHPYMLKHLVYQKWGKLHCLLGRWGRNKAASAAGYLGRLVPYLPCPVG